MAGRHILARIYRPSNAPGLPGHLSLHGGGWKFGSATEFAQAICRQHCREANCVVLAVDYRLAPEHRFPVPLDDCYAAPATSRHLREAIKGHSGSPRRVTLGVRLVVRATT